MADNQRRWTAKLATSERRRHWALGSHTSRRSLPIRVGITALLIASLYLVAPHAAATSIPFRPVATRSSDGLLSWTGITNPLVFDTRAGLFLAGWTNSLGATVTFELARVNRASGHVLAKRPIPAVLDSAVLARGSLFVLTNSASQVSLLRLSVGSLKVTGRWPVTTVSKFLVASGSLSYGRSLAVAGSGLWVSAGDRLLRFSLRPVRVTVSVVLKGAIGSDIATNAGGTMLVVGEADRDQAAELELRSPATGKLLASTASPMPGLTAPRIGGIVDDGVWVSIRTGSLGYVERFDLATMTGASCTLISCIHGANVIAADVANGMLWVTQGVGAPIPNFCANPETGQPLAPIPLPADGFASVLAIGADVIYLVTARVSNLAHQTVTEEQIPPACRLAAAVP